MAITNGLITLNDARKSLGWVDGQQTSDNADLEAYIMAATPVIENITGPIIARTVTHSANGGKRGVALPFPFDTVTSVTVDGRPHTGFVASPDAGIVYADQYGGAFTPGLRNVVVTVTVGGTIPENVKLATRELVRHMWQVGRQGSRPAYGTAEAEGMVPTTFAVPKRVIELLQPNQRPGGFA